MRNRGTSISLEVPEVAPYTSAPSSIDDLPPVCNVAQTAAYLACSEFTVRELIRRGELDHLRLGRLVKIPRHAIARFVGETSEVAS